MRYRDYELKFDPPPVPYRDADWQFAHIDYDGPEDMRAGYGPSFLDCCQQIDEREDKPRVEYYKIGDGARSWLLVPWDAPFFEVARDLMEPTCDDCELPLAVCACEEAAEYDEDWLSEVDALALQLGEQDRIFDPAREYDCGGRSPLADGATAIACAIVGLVVVTLLILALT